MNRLFRYLSACLLFSLLASGLSALASEPGLLDTLRATEFTPSRCAGALGALRKTLPESGRRSGDSAGAIRLLWQARLALRSRLATFLEAGPLPADCVVAARRFFVAAREAEDSLGEQLVRPEPADKKNPRPILSGGFPHTLLAYGQGRFELRSGDVLASRGTAFTSAAIARVADQPGQFSHLSILYIDPKSGEKFVLESLIETGAIVTPFEKYEREGKGRFAVFRHRDARLAALAAHRIYQRVRATQGTSRHIDYDFTMNLGDHTTLVCTELVAWAYEMASRELGRDAFLPLHPSAISRKNRDFLNDIGLRSRSTFLPADMELDPRFDLVVEWRDFGLVAGMRRHDVILDREFDWMERLDYAYSHEVTMQFLRNLAFGLRHSPLAGLVKKHIPANMPKRTLGAVVNLFLASIPMDKYLKAEEKLARDSGGAPLGSRALALKLEALRQEDYKAYQAYQNWIRYDRFNGSDGPGVVPARFHDYFRPRADLGRP